MKDSGKRTKNSMMQKLWGEILTKKKEDQKENSVATFEDICAPSEIVYKKRCTKCKKYYLIGKNHRSAGSYYCNECSKFTKEDSDDGE